MKRFKSILMLSILTVISSNLYSSEKKAGSSSSSGRPGKIISYIDHKAMDIHKELPSKFQEIYISVDIEADGATPLNGNMLSLGAVATDLDMNILGIFEVNLEKQKNMPADWSEEGTMKWWKSKPEIYLRSRINRSPIKEGMKAFVKWMNDLKFNTGSESKWGYSLSMMALPGAYDKMFIQPYAVVYGDKPRGGLDGVGAIDIESLIMMYKKQASYRAIDHTEDVPEFRQQGLNNSHIAIEDALDQAVIGVNLLRWSQGLSPKFIPEELVEKIISTSNTYFGKKEAK